MIIYRLSRGDTTVFKTVQDRADYLFVCDFPEKFEAEAYHLEPWAGFYGITVSKVELPTDKVYDIVSRHLYG